MRSIRKRGDLFDERLCPRSVAVDVPVACLPLGGRRKHTRDLATLWIDRDYTGDGELQTFDDCRPVCLVLDYHGAHRPMHVALPSDLGFGSRSVQRKAYCRRSQFAVDLGSNLTQVPMRNDGIRPAFACLKIVIRETPNISASSSAVSARPILSIRSAKDDGSVALSVGLVPEVAYASSICCLLYISGNQ